MLMSVEGLRDHIKSAHSDDVLEVKLRAIESLIRNYTHNNFQLQNIRSRSEIIDGIILNPPEHVSIGDTIQISDSLLNNGIFTAKEITENGMTVDGDLLDCAKNLITKIRYPIDVVMGAVNMLKWDIENREKVGIQSETISRHSVTYYNMDGDNAIMGYPKSLLGFLKPYMKARF